MYKYFTREEINAASFGTDDGFSFMDETFMHMMDLLRDMRGAPCNVTCFYRAKEYDIDRGRSGNSDHCRGKGADVEVKDHADMLKWMTCAVLVGFNAFGYNSDKKFLHIGKRDGKSVTTWNY